MKCAADIPADPEKGHGFIDSQKYGMEVFRGIPPKRRRWWWWKPSGNTAITCLPGFYTHRGPILTVANWSGEWPGLVGMLNLNASLTKAGVAYSTLWSEDFTDEFFLSRPAPLAGRGDRCSTTSATSRRSGSSACPAEPKRSAARLAAELRRDKAIMGVFDEGCMGMYNAIIPDELLHRDRRLQGAAEPVGAVCRDARRSATRKRAQCARGWTQGHAVPHRPESGDRPHRRPDSRTVQDVHRRRCASPTISAATRSASNTSRG